MSLIQGYYRAVSISTFLIATFVPQKTHLVNVRMSVDIDVIVARLALYHLVDGALQGGFIIAVLRGRQLDGISSAEENGGGAVRTVSVLLSEGVACLGGEGVVGVGVGRRVGLVWVRIRGGGRPSNERWERRRSADFPSEYSKSTPA